MNGSLLGEEVLFSHFVGAVPPKTSGCWQEELRELLSLALYFLWMSSDSSSFTELGNLLSLTPGPGRLALLDDLVEFATAGLRT